MREYFDQPRTYTSAGDVKVGGVASRFALRNTAHGTMALTRSPLRKSETGTLDYGKGKTFVRPYTAPATRAASKTPTAWDSEHHVSVSGILRNPQHGGWATFPTQGNNLRQTVSWALTTAKAMEQALASSVYDLRDGALTNTNK